MKNENKQYHPLTDNEFQVVVNEISDVYGNYRINSDYVMGRLRDITSNPFNLNQTENSSNAEQTRAFLQETFWDESLSLAATQLAFIAIGRKSEVEHLKV